MAKHPAYGRARKNQKKNLEQQIEQKIKNQYQQQINQLNNENYLINEMYQEKVKNFQLIQQELQIKYNKLDEKYHEIKKDNVHYETIHNVQVPKYQNEIKNYQKS